MYILYHSLTCVIAIMMDGEKMQMYWCFFKNTKK